VCVCVSCITLQCFVAAVCCLCAPDMRVIVVIIIIIQPINFDFFFIHLLRNVSLLMYTVLLVLCIVILFIAAALFIVCFDCVVLCFVCA
jgi:hypothetical protein